MNALRKTSRLAALAALLLAWAAAQARAGLVIQVLDSTVQPGGTGSFDVVLKDTDASGSTPYFVTGFSVALSVDPGSGATFTSADASTAAAYLFGTFQSPPPFAFPGFPNTMFLASDSDLTGPDFFVAVNPGDTYGLAHVTYSVAPGTAPGPISVSLDDIGGGTSLTDDSSPPASIPFTPVGGTINVISSVPEPSSLVLVGLGAALALAHARRARARA